MFRILPIMIACIVLVGCKATTIGRHSGINNFIETTYKAEPHYRAFAASGNQRIGYSSGYGAGNDTVEEAMQSAIEYCNKEKLKFVEGHNPKCNVLYIGDVYIHNMSEAEIAAVISNYVKEHNIPSSYSNQTDKNICGMALQNTQVKWEEKDVAYASYVEEAKRRHLTTEKCSQLLGNSQNNLISPSDATVDVGKVSNDIQIRLEKLKSLIDNGLITKEEAARKREEILEGL